MRVSSDDCLSFLKKLCDARLGIIAEMSDKEGQFSCRIVGLPSISPEEDFTIGGDESYISFNRDSVTSCFIDDKLARSGKAVLDSATGVSFATVNLHNGTKIKLRRT